MRTLSSTPLFDREDAQKVRTRHQNTQDTLSQDILSLFLGALEVIF